MRTPTTLIALGACVMFLGACDKTPAPLPTPMVTQPAPTESGTTAGAALAAVPSAESVFPPTNGGGADPASGKTDGTRKPAKESETMPMPGQNNDHSAPLSPAR